VTVIASILWRRLDTPGHDACRLEELEGGWAIDGAAVFHHNGLPARLDYRVECDRAWVTRHGRASGWVGDRSIDAIVTKTSGGDWTLNGRTVTRLSRCLDFDLGFTPATNLISIRRLSLKPGEAADVPVAWLDVDAVGLQLLEQRYERRTETMYWYESPSVKYAELMPVSPDGFVLVYPGLWEAERSYVG
jgi:uncharacterized protein